MPDLIGQRRHSISSERYRSWWVFRAPACKDNGRCSSRRAQNHWQRTSEFMRSRRAGSPEQCRSLFTAAPMPAAGKRL